MAAVRSRDSRIEFALRSALWRRGLRYRLNDRSVLGRPDIVFGPAKVAVFVDSEFWHGYRWGCAGQRAFLFKQHRRFWTQKIEANIRRDKYVTKKLRQMGWVVLRFWGHEVRRDSDACAERVIAAVSGRASARRTHG